MKQTNNHKKSFFLSFFLIVALMLAVLPAAFAEDDDVGGDYTLTIASSTGSIDPSREFQIFQIFYGDVSDDGKLINAKYGFGWDEYYPITISDGGTTTEIYPKKGAPVDERLLRYWSGLDDASLIAKEFHSDSPNYENIVNSGSNFTARELSAGYYIVKETTSAFYLPAGQVASSYLVQLINGDVTLTLKDGTVESYKKVKDKNDTTGAETSWQDSADYDVGDAVPFQLTATLPENFEFFDSYFLAFYDKQDSCFGTPTDIKVYCQKVGETARIDITDSFIIEDAKTAEDQAEYTFRVKCFDLRKVNTNPSGDTPTYGITKDHLIILEYNAVLSPNGVKYGSEGNWNTSWTRSPCNLGGALASTPKDSVVVFTYQLDVNKVVKNAQYNKDDAESKEFVPKTGAQFKLEKQIGNTWKEIPLSVEEATFTAKGIDDGRYRLTETKAPAGYNKIDPIYFTVTATHTNDGDSKPLQLTELIATETDQDGNKKDNGLVFTQLAHDTLSIDVVNKAGTPLPATGGMGTTVFYVIGTVLALGAAIALIAKKRVSR